VLLKVNVFAKVIAVLGVLHLHTTVFDTPQLRIPWVTR